MTSSKLICAAIQSYSFLVIALFLSSADLFLGRIKVIPAPTVTCLLLLFPLFALAIIRDFYNKDRGSELLYVLKNNAVAVIAFGLVVFFSLVLALHPDAFWDEKGKWIFLLLYGFVIFLLAMCLPAIPEVRSILRWASISGLMLLSASIATDVFFPGTFSNLAARAAGFPQNSNWGALSTVMVCCGCLSLRKKNIDPSNIGTHSQAESKPSKINSIVLGLAAMSVFATLSRSGMTEFLVVLVYYSYVRVITGGLRVKQIFIMCVSGVFSLGLLALIASVVMENSEMFTKYRTRLTSIGSSSSIDDGSSEHRLRAIGESLDLISRAPIIGNGTAYTRRMRELPHNMFLMQWVNNGIFGLLSYLVLLLTSFWTFYKRSYYPGQAFVAAVFVGSFFSHNILDQRPFLIILGVMWTISLHEWQDVTGRRPASFPLSK